MIEAEKMMMIRAVGARRPHTTTQRNTAAWRAAIEPEPTAFVVMMRMRMMIGALIVIRINLQPSPLHHPPPHHHLPSDASLNISLITTMLIVIKMMPASVSSGGRGGGKTGVTAPKPR